MNVVKVYDSYQSMAMKNINRAYLLQYNILNVLMNAIVEVPIDIIAKVVEEFPELSPFAEAADIDPGVLCQIDFEQGHIQLRW